MGNEKKIKIIRIIARLNIGGPAIHTILLTNGLNKEKFDSVLVTGAVGKGEEDMLYLAHEKQVRPVLIPQLQREICLYRDLVAFWKIFLLIKKERPDIIHTHTAKAGTLGRLAGALYNLLNLRKKSKLIHTFHGTVLQGYFGKTKSHFFIAVERFLAFLTDRIVVVSSSIKNQLLSFRVGTPEKISVIPLGLELEGLLSLAPAVENPKLKIGIVGRLVPVKNHRLFLEGAKSFIDKKTTGSNSCRFIIFGDGELRQVLERYVLKLKMSEFVEFRGWQLQVTEIYSLLDIVVLTSINEGTPLSLIEAMAASRPVISTDAGGVKDLFINSQDYGLSPSDNIRIYGNGILCRSYDSEGLAEALGLLITDSSLREKMGANGRSFVRERFSKERLIKDIEMLYNNCFKKE